MIERVTIYILVAALAMSGFSPLFIAVRKLNQMEQCVVSTHQYLECHNEIYRLGGNYGRINN